MLTKNVTATRDVPGEPGTTMTFRQLSWVQLMEAEEVRSTKVLRNLRTMGGELMRELQGIAPTTPDSEAVVTTPVAKPDPVEQLDQGTVLRYGIAAWSYPEPVIAENINLLDAATAKWATEQIVKLGAPPLEQEQEQAFPRSQIGSTETPGLALVSLTNGSSR